MQTFKLLFNGQETLLVLLSAFIIGGVFKSHKLFLPVFELLLRHLKSKRLGLLMISLVSGILPIEGRVSVSAPVLDSLVLDTHKPAGSTCCCPKETSPHTHVSTRSKMGILDFLATHHYYLWSPLEKSVLIVMAGLGLTYPQFLAYTALPLFLYLTFLVVTVFTYIKEEDIAITEPSLSDEELPSVFHILPFFLGIALSVVFSPAWVFPFVALYYILLSKTGLRTLFSFIRWDTLAFVALVIAAANVLKSNSGAIQDLLVMKTANADDFVIVGAILGGAAASFLMGSSSKYGGITVLLTVVLGIQYLPLILMADYIGYLLSPVHKCFIIVASYFNTPWVEFYRKIGMLCLLMALAGTLVYLVPFMA